MEDDDIEYISDDADTYHESDADTFHESELDTSSEPDRSGLVGFLPAIMGNLPVMSHNADGGAAEVPEEGAANETFNEDLPAVHSYLGENLEEVSGRMIFTELRFVIIPILTGQYGPLLPGQTFPLTLRDRGGDEVLRRCIEGDHTFGCVSSRQTDFTYGTTAEVYEYSDEMGTICIKAKGRQRFKLISTKVRRPEGSRLFRMAEVRILPEVKLSHPFNALDFKSLNGLRATQKEKCRMIEAKLLFWPKWVYDMYDPEKLVVRADKLTFLKQGLRKDKGKEKVMPKDPTELSFWIASHLDAEKRLFMLKLNSPIPRLRWLLNYLSKNQEYVCSSCEVRIGKQSDVFAMSIEGPQSTYVNAEGCHHDTFTLLKAENIIPVSSPSTHFSWFPGYAWSIAVCRQCQIHLGWQFIAHEAKLRPSKFWGLTRHSLYTRVGSGDAELDPSEKPVM